VKEEKKSEYKILSKTVNYLNAYILNK